MSSNQQPVAQSSAPTPVDLWADTDRGRSREVNEDSIFPNPKASQSGQTRGAAQLAARGVMAIVADGVGGAQVGSRVSERAVRYVSDGYYDGPAPDLLTNLQQAVESANLWLWDLVRRDASLTQAASTLTAAVIQGNTLLLAHVGDSRAYLVRQGTITQLTHDHTLAQEKVDAGHLRPEDVPNDPDHSRLTRWLVSPDAVKPDLRVETLAPGDVVVLCSDGLYDMVGDDEIRAIAERSPARKAVKQLIDLANRRGGRDNISVVVMRLPGGVAAAAGASNRTKAALVLLWAAVVIMILALAAIVLAYSGVLSEPTPITAAPLALVTGSPAPGSPAAPGTPLPAVPTPGTLLQPTSTPLVPTQGPAATASPARRPTNTPRQGQTPKATPTAPRSRPPAPELLKPDAGERMNGQWPFIWSGAAGPLARGLAYDLVIWSEAEQREAARGVAPPTQATQITVDLDNVPAIRDYGPGTYYWAVIVVRVTPYQRVGEWGESRKFFYASPPGPTQPPQPTADPCAGFVCADKCCGDDVSPLCGQCCAGFTCP
jgi:serine/threonine protein phosphatase PrpC